ncbi:unnamed protein product [Lepeophtheirus salmonis]|uniref:(salmon louse) hypothetical protein n=1 Tax=Lepeophtheirus salmonis TaxID=72036 RepID=A0A7R8CXW2_LEPSM|nr:unnamed protein product [Lepeophtheirus salmonis]CAF2965496.1 unnamed protein product [Lepeophtheirus salmonis]
MLDGPLGSLAFSIFTLSRKTSFPQIYLFSCGTRVHLLIEMNTIRRASIETFERVKDVTSSRSPRDRRLSLTVMNCIWARNTELETLEPVEGEIVGKFLLYFFMLIDCIKQLRKSGFLRYASVRLDYKEENLLHLK